MELDGSRGACDRRERERGASLVHSIAQLRADTPLRQSARGFDVTVVLDLFPFLFQLFRVFFSFLPLLPLPAPSGTNSLWAHLRLNYPHTCQLLAPF